MKTVIITPDLVGPIRNGGIGTFVLHFARVLRESQHDVTILFTSPPEVAQRHWQTRYDQLGITVIQITEPAPLPDAHGNWWFFRRSAAAAAYLDAADVVYAQDWHASGMHFARMRRYQGGAAPALVTVLHGCSSWSQRGMRMLPPSIDEALALEFAERYTAEHSDFVAAPSQYIIDWVYQEGWILPERTSALCLPYFPTQPQTEISSPDSAFRKILFFGRLETRKGLDLFFDAMIAMKDEEDKPLASIQEVILLGKDGLHRYGTAQDAADFLQVGCGIPVRVLDQYDTIQAQCFLAENTPDTLVVIPTLMDNMPYAVLESLALPNLNLLVSAVGGIPEVLSDGAYTFPPHRQGLIEALKRRLIEGPQARESLYDWESHNQRWLQFHEEICAFQHQRKNSASQQKITSGTVDVIVPFYNQGKYLYQTLQALEQQTDQDFGVIVIDDGSDDPQSQRVFLDTERRYTKRGWRFIQSPKNQGASAARNHAAAQSGATYIIFVDSDNIPVPTMIERYRTAIQNSDDDCLTCYLTAFTGHQFPYTVDATGTVKLMASTSYHYHPIGDDMIYGMINNIFGDLNCILRRTVFLELGGFAIHEEGQRYAGYEDYAFFAKLSLAGYRMDVLPETLFYYRHRETSISRTLDPYQSKMRVIQEYTNGLEDRRLKRVPRLIWELYVQEQGGVEAFRQHDPIWVSNYIPWYILIRAFWFKIKKHLPRWL